MPQINTDEFKRGRSDLKDEHCHGKSISINMTYVLHRSSGLVYDKAFVLIDSKMSKY